MLHDVPRLCMINTIFCVDFGPFLKFSASLTISENRECICASSYDAYTDAKDMSAITLPLHNRNHRMGCSYKIMKHPKGSDNTALGKSKIFSR